MFHFVKTIERGNPVAFSVGRIVEDLINKIVDPRIKTHCNLSDVDHFRRSTSDNMDAENL